MRCRSGRHSPAEVRGELGAEVGVILQLQHGHNQIAQGMMHHSVSKRSSTKKTKKSPKKGAEGMKAAEATAAAAEDTKENITETEEADEETMDIDFRSGAEKKADAEKQKKATAARRRPTTRGDGTCREDQRGRETFQRPTGEQGAGLGRQT